MRTLTRAIQRHARRTTSTPVHTWVNDEQFEILESGVLADEPVEVSRSGQPIVPV